MTFSSIGSVKRPVIRSVLLFDTVISNMTTAVDGVRDRLCGRHGPECYEDRPDPIFRYLSVDLNTGVLGFLALLVLFIKTDQ